LTVRPVRTYPVRMNVTLSIDDQTAVAEMERLWNEEEGDSHGWKWNREEAHDRSVFRRTAAESTASR
jgi:hypothetical protein